MVTGPVREQPTIPVTTTWTADFLTREGKGRRAMGAWMRDKSIPWKARQRLLRQIREHFRVSPASRNGASTQMEYMACVNDAERWAWDSWVGNPLEALQVICKAACADSNLQRPPVRITLAFSKCKRTCARPAQCARNGTSSRKERKSRWEGS